MTTYTIYGGTGLDDVTINANNSQANYTYNGTSAVVGNHFDANFRPASGFVFDVPPELNGLSDYSTITDAYIQLYRHEATSGSSWPGISTGPMIRLTAPPAGGTGGAFPTAHNTTNSPVGLYNANTGVTAIAWNSTNGGYEGLWPQNTYQRGPNIALQLRNYLTANPSATRFCVNIIGQTGSNMRSFCYAQNGGTGPPTPTRPRFIIEADVETEPMDVDLNSISGASPGATVRTGTDGSLAREDLNYDFDNSRTVVGVFGPNDRRVMDYIIPWTPMPTGGFKTIVFVHGGGFSQGDENTSDEQHRIWARYNGYAFASLRYALSDQNGTDNIITHPMHEQDIATGIQYITDYTAESDPEFVVLTAYSAGGHLVMEYCMTYDDTDTYNRIYNGPAGNPRTPAEPNTGTEFTFRQGRGPGPRPRGVYIWAGVMDMSQITEPLLYGPKRGFFGGTTAAGFFNEQPAGEGDMSALAAGTAGTPYAGKPHDTQLAGIPIAYVEAVQGDPLNLGAEDQVVPPVAGINPLKTLMTNAGLIDIPAIGTVNGLNLKGTLSHYKHYHHAILPHDWVYANENFDDNNYPLNRSEAEDWNNWMTWLEGYTEVFRPVPPSSTAGIPTPSISTGSGGGSNAVTTIAPIATTAVPPATATVAGGLQPVEPLVTTGIGTVSIAVPTAITATGAAVGTNVGIHVISIPALTGAVGAPAGVFPGTVGIAVAGGKAVTGLPVGTQVPSATVTVTGGLTVSAPTSGALPGVVNISAGSGTVAPPSFASTAAGSVTIMVAGGLTSIAPVATGVVPAPSIGTGIGAEPEGLLVASMVGTAEISVAAGLVSVAPRASLGIGTSTLMVEAGVTPPAPAANARVANAEGFVGETGQVLSAISIPSEEGVGLSEVRRWEEPDEFIEPEFDPPPTIERQVAIARVLRRFPLMAPLDD